MANFKLTQAERLCGKKRIDALFTSGNSFIVYPYRIVYRSVSDTDNVPVSMFVSIPKKRFKRAVKRNLIRRRIKEAYRKNKHILTDTINTRLLLSGMYFSSQTSNLQVCPYMFGICNRSHSQTRSVQRPLVGNKKNLPLSPLGRKRL